MTEPENPEADLSIEPENPIPEYPDSSALSDFLEKYGLYLFCGVLLVMLLILFGSYIFSNRVFLFKDIGSDLINGLWPAYYHFSQYIREEGIPKWAFAQGLGQNVFPAQLGDASGWLLYLAGPANIPYVLVYVVMFKLFFAGVIFYLFLRKISFSAYVALMGASFFTFSGFMAIGSCWFLLATEGCYLVLLLYSLELLRRNNNLLVFPIAVALAAANNPVLFYLDSLLAGTYLLFHFILQGFTKSSAIFSIKIILLGTLGLGISSFLMFGNIFQMLESPRGTGSASFFKVLSSQPLFSVGSADFFRTFIIRMFGNDLAGYAGVNDQAFSGWYNYLEAPMQYCGLLSLLLIPQLFVLANRKLKIWSAVALSLALFPVIFPYFRYAFWLFSGDYFRTFSLFFNVMQILLAVKSLQLILDQRKLHLSLLAVSLGIILIILFTVSIPDETLKIPVALFLICEAALLWLLMMPRYFRIAYVLLPVIVFTESTFMSWGTFNKRDTMVKAELVRKIGYNDYTNDAMKMIHAVDKGFFRIEKNYSSGLSSNVSLNDAVMQDFYSSRSYQSFNQKNYVNFLQKMGLISDTVEAQTRWINGIGQHLPLLQLVSNKYLLLVGSTNSIDQIGYDSIARFDNISVFRYRYFLPLGFTYDACISEGEMEKVVLHKDFLLLKGAVADSAVLESELSGFRRISAADTIGTDSPEIYREFLASRRQDTLQITTFSQNHIHGNIEVTGKKLLFFSIPFDPGWKAKIDGRETKAIMVNYGFLGYVLDKGSHEIELTYTPPYYEAGMKISCLSLLLYAGLAIIVFVRKKKSGK